MIKKTIIFIIVFLVCIILALHFLEKKINYNIDLMYIGNISSKENIIMYHNFSGQYKNNEEYNIRHDINIKQEQNNIMNIILHQIHTQGAQNITLENYSILTGQGNYQLTIFEQEFLKKNKNKTWSGIENINGIEYQNNYKKGLFRDTFSLQGTYTNQLNQKNYYTITLKINCGITQYITHTKKCTINGEIGLDLPINTYTKTWYIQGILYKQIII